MITNPSAICKLFHYFFMIYCLKSRYVYNQLISIKCQQTLGQQCIVRRKRFYQWMKRKTFRNGKLLTSGQLLADNVGERGLGLGGGVLGAVTVGAARPVPVRGAAAEGGAASPLRGPDAQHRLEFQRSLQGSARHF